MTETVANNQEFIPYEILKKQVSWLEEELKYAEDKIAKDKTKPGAKQDQDTELIRHERHIKSSEDNSISTLYFIKQHIGRFNLYENARQESIKRGAKVDEIKKFTALAFQQLGKIANVFADSTIWLKKKCKSEIIYTDEYEIEYEHIEINDELFETLAQIMQDVMAEYRNGNIESALKKADEGWTLALKIWAQYIQDTGLSESKWPKPGLPSGNIEDWEVK